LLPAPPADAAPTECFGRRITILGTNDVDRLVGTPARDVIHGRGQEDRIVGKGGNDLICGGDDFGGDRIKGGGGNDRIAGGKGLDVIRGGSGRDRIFADCGDCFDPGGPFQRLYGGAGNDRIVGSNEKELVRGGKGNDTIEGRGSVWDGLEGPDLLYGGPDNDNITGGVDPPSESNVGALLYGEDGDDVLRDIDGDSRLDGGNGNDLLEGSELCCTSMMFETATTGVEVDLGAGRAMGQGEDPLTNIHNVSGTEHADLLIGSDAENFFTGLGGHDTIVGAGGDDGAEAGVGDDIVDGGEGSDRISFSRADRGVVVDLEAGSAVGEGSDTLDGIEDVFGTSHADTILGNDEANEISISGNDVADGRGGSDTIAVGGPGTPRAGGGEGNDSIIATFAFGTPELVGGAGDDYIVASIGNDSIDGGPGRDLLDFGKTTLTEGGVTVDLASGTASGRGSDTITAIEDVRGTIQDDLIKGDAGPNTIEGIQGSDEIFGVDGDDHLDGGAGDFSRPTEHDFLDGGGGTDVCVRGEETLECEA
jgi:Ca2+-binding RTX toxin-like protein